MFILLFIFKYLTKLPIFKKANKEISYINPSLTKAFNHMAKKLLTSIAFLFIVGLLIGQPMNDNCSDAIVISSAEDLPFSTFGANTDGPSHPDDCPSSGSTPDSTYNDIWYLYVADFTGQALFTLCNTAVFDTKIIVYAPGTSCPPADDDLIACNEDGAGCENATSSTIFDVEEGQMYLLRIGGWGDGSPGEEGTGTFSIGEYDPSGGPENDLCSGAIEIILDDNDFASVEFSSVGAGSNGPVYDETFSCFDVPNGETTVFNDIWFTWTATFNGWAEFSNCGLANFDSRIAVYGPDQSCLPDPFELVGCSDDGIDEDGFNCPGFTSRALFPVVEGSTYLLSLGGWSNSDAGNGTVILQRTTPPIPPDNDLCSDPDSTWILSLEDADDFLYVFESFTFNATGGQTPNPSCRPTGEFLDVWYKFNSGFNTDITLRFNKTSTNAEFVIDLYSGCAQQADTLVGGFCIRTDQYNETFIEELISNFPGEPTEYLLRVSTSVTFDAPGEFWLQLIGQPYTGLPEVSLDNFRFFPNPVTDIAQVTFQLEEAADVGIAVLNAMGQEVIKQDIGRLSTGAQSLEIPTSQLQPGIYFLRMLLPEGQKTVKFVKQ